MGWKATGTKPGQKSNLQSEHIEFLETYGEQFTAGSENGSLYSEVLEAWIQKFGYAGLNPKNKNGIDLSELRLDVEFISLTEDKREKVLKVRAMAQQAIHDVRVMST